MNAATLPPSSHDGGVLSSDEIAAFRRFVSQLDHSSTAHISSFAHSGTIASTLSASLTSS